MKHENIRFNILGGTSKIDANEDRWGEIHLVRGKNELGKCTFFIDEYEIYLDLIIIHKKNNRQKGYGSMMLDVLKGLARLYNKPICLDAVANKEFYLRSGLVTVTDPNLLNVKLEEGNWTERDMIWLPETLLNSQVIIH